MLILGNHCPRFFFCCFKKNEFHTVKFTVTHISVGCMVKPLIQELIQELFLSTEKNLCLLVLRVKHLFFMTD